MFASSSRIANNAESNVCSWLCQFLERKLLNVGAPCQVSLASTDSVLLHISLAQESCWLAALKIHTCWQVGPMPQMVSGFWCTLATQPTSLLAWKPLLCLTHLPIWDKLSLCLRGADTNIAAWAANPQREPITGRAAGRGETLEQCVSRRSLQKPSCSVHSSAVNSL